MHNSFANAVMQKVCFFFTTRLTCLLAVVLRRVVFSHAPLPFDKNNNVTSSVLKITEFMEPKCYSKSIACEPQ
jgi:hypothetical protein